MRRCAVILTILFVVAACSGGSSDGGGGSLQGPTTHAGRWTLTALITAIVAGTTFNIETTSLVNIQSNGAVGILSTNTDCALSIFVNGNIMTYREECVFPGATGGDGENGQGSDRAPCTLEMEAIARIVSTTTGSGTFGPESLVCSGSAASYSGTLVAVRDGTLPQPARAP